MIYTPSAQLQVQALVGVGGANQQVNTGNLASSTNNRSMCEELGNDAPYERLFLPRIQDRGI